MFSYFTENFIELKSGVSFILIALFSCLAISVTFTDYHAIISDAKLSTLTKNKRALLLVSVYLINYLFVLFLYILLSSLLNYLFIEWNIGIYYLRYAVFLLLIVTQIAIFHKKTLNSILVIAAVLDLSLITISTLCELLSYFITLEIAGSLYQFLLSFFYIFAISLILLMFYLTSISQFKKREMAYLFAILFAAVFSIFSTLFINPNLSTTTNSKIKYTIIYVCIESISIVLYLLYYFTLKGMEKSFKAEASAYKAKVDAMMDMKSQENYYQLLEMQKQVYGQYNQIEDYLNKNDLNGLKLYFADLYENNFVPLTFIDCGNATISSIMNIELSKCVKNQIELKHTILVPSRFSFLDYDLCSLFTNIIDNAIEETINHPIQERIIRVNIRYQSPYLVATITNPTTHDSEELPSILSSTHKSQKELHGFGTKIINEITNKYNGTINYRIIENKFIVSLMILEKERKDV